MIGSLEEFIGEVDKVRFLESQPQRSRKTRSSEDRFSSRNQKFTQRKKDNHINFIKFAQSTRKKLQSQRTSPKNSSKKIIHFNATILKEKRMPKQSKWSSHHIADDKSVLLNSYIRVRQNEQISNQMKITQNLRKSELASKPTQIVKPMFLHLKGYLKHEHQLLRSIVRVQEEDLVNHKTFFEMSLNTLQNGFQKIKTKPYFGQFIAQKLNSEKIIDKIEQKNNKTISPFRQQKNHQRPFKNMLNQSRFSTNSKICSSDRLLLQSSIRWAKIRAKSTQSFQKSLGKEEDNNYSQDQSTKNKKRKQLLKKIADLIEKPKSMRKNSLRKSSLYSSSKIFK